MMRIVIDTNVFDNAYLGQNGKELKDNCQNVLVRFMKRDDLIIVFDNTFELDGTKKGIIISEYRHKLGGHRDFEKYIMGIQSQGKVCYLDIYKRDFINIEKELLKVKFHEPSDQVFVYASLKSDRIIITDDSDYGVHGNEHRAAYRYISEELGIVLYTAKQFANAKM